MLTPSGLREHSDDLPISLGPLTGRWKRGIIRRMNDPQPRGSHGKPHRTTKILSRLGCAAAAQPLAVSAQQSRAGSALMFVCRRATAAPRSSIAISYMTLRPEGMMAYQETFVQRDQHRIHVRDHPGAEPAIILMHGFPDNVHLYDRLSPYLSPPRRVVLFDFLGWGSSDKPSGYPS